VVKIYTGTGDAGETGLFGGDRVPKDHPRVSAYGEVDELNAAIGWALALDPTDFERPLLEAVQRDLFRIGAELATPEPAKLLRSRPDAEITADRIQALENAIDAHAAALPPLRNFILPGGTPKAAALHLARTVCRRAERRVVEISHTSAVSPTILRYVNRLSDLLFMLARSANARAGRGDVAW
jgi:cob(I)alamin adenosyltransferase